jgi:internalin A
MQPSRSTAHKLPAALAALALLASCGLSALAAPPPKNNLPEGVVEAWTKAGASYGWIPVHRLRFREPTPGEPDKMADDLPAFRFMDVGRGGMLARLPVPAAPFGLELNQVTDAGLKELARLKSLQALSLGGPKVTDAGLKELARLKSLQKLELSHTGVTDAGLKHLAALKSLRELDLSLTKVTHAGLKELAGMKLKRLNFDRSLQTDVGLKHYLAAVEPPTFEILFGWKLTDDGLKELAAQKSLQELDLRYTDLTDVTDAGFEELRKALPHCKISR